MAEIQAEENAEIAEETEPEEIAEVVEEIPETVEEIPEVTEESVEENTEATKKKKGFFGRLFG